MIVHYLTGTVPYSKRSGLCFAGTVHFITFATFYPVVYPLNRYRKIW
nr:MAG TPA: hypothetical protein [Bacteriophage sp.]